MPPFFRAISRIIPATYYIQILRGIILRGAGFADLWLNALILTLMGCTTILLAAHQFVSQRGR
jgi:ABC-2 type transport system permease protein